MRNKVIIGTNEAISTSTIRKDRSSSNWYIVYKCINCDTDVKECIDNICKFKWEIWESCLDQKIRICHFCTKDTWYYSTVLIKGKSYGKR